MMKEFHQFHTGQACHQHTLPRFPQVSGLFSVEHLLLASEPLAQIVASRGCFLAQMNLSTVEIAFVGMGVGLAVVRSFDG